MLHAVPPPDQPAEAVVVTGQALPATRGDRAHHVEVIAADALARSPAQALDSLLVQVPGLQIFRRSDATSGHPTSQGVTLRALGGNASSRALLILDGVPQADPFGGWVNWPAYDPAGLAEVRITRGGGSLAHGPGALAGTIALRSRTQDGFATSLEAGGRQSLRGQTFIGQRIGDSLLTVNLHGARGDGFVPITRATRGPVDRAAPYRQGGMRVRWTAPLTQDVEVQLGALGFIDERERGVAFTENRTRGGDLSLRLVGRGRWQWSATGFAQWRDLRSGFASVGDNRQTAARVALQDNVPSRGFGAGLDVRPPLGGGIDLRLGADLRSVTGESRELYAFAGGDPTRRRIAGGESLSFGLFAEAGVTRGPLTLSGGVRLDHMRIFDGQLVERLLAGGPPTRHDIYESRSRTRPTARAGAIFELSRDASLRLAAYSGWRLPTLNELFRPFRAGPDATAANAMLDPEGLVGVDLGFDWRRGGIELRVTAFANRLSKAIANVTLGRGPGVFPGVGFVAGQYRQRLNVDAVRVYGLEASAAARRGPWSLRLGASLADARVAADGPAAALDGLRPAQTPSLVLTAAAGWESRGRAASLMFRHSGPQYEDDLNRRRLPAATTMDAFVAWPLSRRLQLVARAQNLLDEQVVAGVDGDGTVERGTPRTLWLGLRFGS